MTNTHDLSANILDFGLSVNTGIVQPKVIASEITVKLSTETVPVSHWWDP